MGKVLFEIGVEEIPSRFIPSALVQIEENFKRILSEARVDLFHCKTLATPRRLTLIAELSPKQASEERVVWGPPAHVAYSETGEPKEPAYAFAKAQAVAVESLQIRQKGKGKYVCAVISEEGKDTQSLLPTILKNLFFSLHFPKIMRWGNGSLRFPRPVRWLLALYDNRAVELEIDGIRAGEHTKGHRFLSDGFLKIEKIDDYESVLEKAYVIVDQNRRKELIIEQANQLAKKVDGEVLWNEALLEEVVYLTEYPQSFLCSFSEDYLELPEELLITVMKDHQRNFAVKDSRGLKNYFIVVSNTVSENQENIRKGAERVLRARFEDARFYFKEDLKKGIDSLLEATKGIVYHKSLGSLFDKTLRITGIVERLCHKIMPEGVEQAKVAAKYSKADLASGVVGEFPELQGIMGYYYTKAKGLPQEVAIAIKEHYSPKGFLDPIPSNDFGCLLSIADKLDHISSFFYLGEVPSGTEDPFGLRRAGNGIITVLAKRRYRISLSEILDTVDIYNDKALKEKILTFLVQRLESYLEQRGFDLNSIKTVNDFMVNRPIYEIEKRLEALNDFRKRELFEEFFLAVKRTENIIRNYEKFNLSESLLNLPEEKALYDAVEKIKDKLREYLAEEKFYEALECLSQLTPTINQFFDRVLVMDKNEEIKRNRLALLQYLSEHLRTVLDLSKLY